MGHPEKESEGGWGVEGGPLERRSHLTGKKQNPSVYRDKLSLRILLCYLTPVILPVLVTVTWRTAKPLFISFIYTRDIYTLACILKTQDEFRWVEGNPRITR